MTFPFQRIRRLLLVNALILPINLLVAWGLHYFGMDYRLATLCGYLVHLVIYVLVGKKFVFTDSTATVGGAMARAFVVEIVSIVILLSSIHYLIEYLGWRFIYARPTAIVFTGLWDYVGHSLVTFLKNPFKK